MIIPNDYEVPEPEPGERPVSARKAAQQRGRMVYVSQLRAVMEAPEVVACS